MAEKKLYTYILVDNGVDPEQLILWDTLDVTIGRNPDRDVVLTSTEVSREHAAFKREGNTYCILDNHTGNGTFVNETQVIRHELKNGDVVRVGDALFTFKQSFDNPMAGRRGAKYASQLKNFGVPGMNGDEGGRTIMALGDPLVTPGITADGIDLRPTDEMEFQLDDLNAAFQTTYPSRDVDLDALLSTATPTAQPATRAAEEFAELELTDEEPVSAPVAPAMRPTPAAHASTQKRVAPPSAQPQTTPHPAAPSATSQRSTAPTTAAQSMPKQAQPLANTAPGSSTQKNVGNITPRAVQPERSASQNIESSVNENAKTIALEVQTAPPTSAATQSAVSFNVQIEGLTPELKRVLCSLFDKPITLPPLKICLSAKKNTP